MRVPFGKYRGHPLDDLPNDYLEWLAEIGGSTGKEGRIFSPMSKPDKFLQAAERDLDDFDGEDIYLAVMNSLEYEKDKEFLTLIDPASPRSQHDGQNSSPKSKKTMA